MPGSLLELPHCVLVHALGFTNLPDRCSSRLVCKQLSRACPVPFYIAAKALEAANAFDICFKCEQRSKEGCDCGSNELDASEFARFDPRRTAEYKLLAAKVAASSHLEPGFWASTHAADSEDLLRMIWNFSLQSVRRLVRHFHFQIVVELMRAWRRPDFQCRNPHEESTYNSHAENAHERKLAELYGPVPGGSARYRLLWELARLNVAAEELRGNENVYHYARDRENHLGRICISTSAGESERVATCFWVHGIFGSGLFGFRVRNVPPELQGAEPGSDAHLKYLLQKAWGRCPQHGYFDRQSRPDLYSVFGERLVDEFLDPIRPFHDAWPALLELINDIDERFLSATRFGDNSNPVDVYSFDYRISAALDDDIPAYDHLGRLEEESCTDDENGEDDEDDEDLDLAFAFHSSKEHNMQEGDGCKP
jgi:hypothetical protein